MVHGLELSLDAFEPALKLVSTTVDQFYASSNIYHPLNMSGFEPNRVYSIAVPETPAATAPDSPAETEKLL